METAIMSRAEVETPVAPLLSTTLAEQVAAVASTTTPTSVAEPAEDTTGVSGHVEATSSEELVTNDDGKNCDAAKSPVETKELPSVVSYHQNAELYLQVRDSADTFIQCKVVSALIVAASPKLSDLLDNFKPIKGADGKLIVQLADGADSYYGINVVLSIIHYKFHEIPDRPDIDQLYSIAQVVEKYDCAHLLLPYMGKWVAGLDWHLVMKGDDNDDDKTLFLTWAFGEGRWFTRMLSKAAHKATLADDGTLLDACGQPWEDQGLPPNILELIKQTRYECLKKIVRAIGEPLQGLMSGDNETLDYCRSKDGDMGLKQACQHLQLGSLMTSLATARLLPFPAAKEYKGSVADLAKMVRAIKVSRFKLPGIPPHLDSHTSCGIDYEEVVDGVMREKVRLTVDIVNQLKLHAQKCGAVGPETFQDLEHLDGEVASSESILKSLRLNPVHFTQVLDTESHLESFKEGDDADITTERSEE
ncbi:uncharacterized protein B0H64DRAFT_365203 [Chaetomium fimeti]|uniref:BTB domain-containing protein n=1 Tax=Chaetomium fimeti TaxID=1854472 RepID=A0AAE0LPD1_9PEZI|nr:hypothetical protein B0H64DRAFT_365203 [Chaetomium fimeti]